MNYLQIKTLIEYIVSKSEEYKKNLNIAIVNI